jgi:hypothetical protein
VDGCYIDCNLKCYEPKYAEVVAKERYEPPELSIHEVKTVEKEEVATVDPCSE